MNFAYIKQFQQTAAAPLVDLHGTGRWYQNGVLHRLDGPAVEYAGNGPKEWWVNGKRHRLDGPAIEVRWSKKWYQNGELHRLDGPAVENTDGTKFWYREGKEYHADGTLVERSDQPNEILKSATRLKSGKLAVIFCLMLPLSITLLVRSPDSTDTLIKGSFSLCVSIGIAIVLIHRFIKGQL